MEGISREEILESARMIREMRGVSTPPSYFPVQIFDSPYLTETEEYTEVIPLTFRQRWIDPLCQPATMPFEPWVKNREVTKTREVPSRKILQVGTQFFMHPLMRKDAMAILGNICY